jgi:TrkA domain protein
MAAMTRIEETQLPGVGVRHDFKTRGGARVGVISHRTGRRELLIYAERDPDACSEVLHLDEDEGHALADLLGGTSLAEASHDMTQHVEGLIIDWVTVAAVSPAAGQSLVDCGMRRETGATVVAVIRDRDTIAAPGAEFVLDVGDIAVVVGTPEGIAQITQLLRGS